jgi:hypothetical protein
MEALTFWLLTICFGLLVLVNAMKPMASLNARYARLQLVLLVVATIACIAGMICGIKFSIAGTGPHLQR